MQGDNDIIAMLIEAFFADSLSLPGGGNPFLIRMPTKGKSERTAKRAGCRLAARAQRSRLPMRFAMKIFWIAIAALAVVAGIALLFSGGEPPANPADQPGEVSIPDDRIGSGIR